MLLLQLAFLVISLFDIRMEKKCFFRRVFAIWGRTHTAKATTARIVIPNIPSALTTHFLLHTETGLIDNSCVASE